MKWYQLDKRYSLVYVKLLFMSLLYVFPLILANVYYEDDLARVQYGATGWKEDGRPLGEALIVWMSGGTRPVIDLAPLPLLLSMLLLVYVLVLYAKANWNAKFSDCMQIMVLLFILVNPFAMANLSYRFDCIMMFTALSMPFFMYSIPDTIPRICIGVCYFISAIIVMSLYQPAICMYFVLCIVQLFLYLVGESRKIGQELYRMAGVGAGAVIYKLVIARHYVSKNDWRQGASSVVSNLKEASIIFSNIERACRYIKDSILGTSPINIVVVGILVILAVLAAVLSYWRISGQSRMRKTAGSIFIAVSPIIVFFCCFFPLMLLETLGLKSRIFISLGGFLFFIGILLMYSVKKYHVIVTVLCAVCILYQYTYMYSYGNALRSQNEYQKYVVYNVAHDLETINCDGDFTSVTMIGTMPRARQTRLICDKYPLISELVPVYITNDTWRGGVWLYLYLQDGLTIEPENDTDLQAINDSEPILENTIYSCYLNGEKIIIYFGDEEDGGYLYGRKSFGNTGRTL